MAGQPWPDLTVSEGHEADRRLATPHQRSQGMALPSVIKNLNQVPEPHGPNSTVPRNQGLGAIKEHQGTQEDLEGQGVFDEPAHGGGD